MLVETTLTDPQGQTFEGAVIRVISATRSKNSNSSETTRLTTNPNEVNADAVEATDDYESYNDSVECSYGYWASQAAYENGHAPYILVDSTNRGSSQFLIRKDELEKSKYAGLLLEQVCETYFTDVVLPTLN